MVESAARLSQTLLITLARSGTAPDNRVSDAKANGELDGGKHRVGQAVVCHRKDDADGQGNDGYLLGTAPDSQEVCGGRKPSKGKQQCVLGAEVHMT